MKIPLSVSGLEKFPLPFWMLDLKNFSLITNRSVPQSVDSDKAINYAEILVPGGSSSDNRYSSMGSEQISFTVRVAAFNNTIGAYALAAQYRNLRMAGGFLDGFYGDTFFKSNPTVYLSWGTGNVLPMEYYVTKVGFKNQNFNNLGQPQVIDINLNFRLNEDSALYRMEKMATKVASVLGTVQGLTQAFPSQKDGNPYRS